MRRVSMLGAWLLAATPLAAQWDVSIEFGELRFSGASFDTSTTSEPAALRPSGGGAYRVSIDRWFGSLGVGVGLLYCGTGAAAENEETVVEIKGVSTLYEVAPEALLVLATPRAGGTLALAIGPLYDHWTFDGYDDRNTLGAHAAVSLDLPLDSTWFGTFRIGVAVSPSPWRAEDLPEGYERRMMWRRSFAAGVRLRL